MRCALLVPGPFGAISGGYVYNARIIEGLCSLGHTVRVVELGGRHPLPDAAAEAAARQALDALSPQERPILDSLGLPAFAGCTEELARRGAIGLIHHPTAQEHGLPAATQIELAAREAAVYPRLARLIATSRFTAAGLAATHGIAPTQIGVVEPGTDPAARAGGSGGPGIALLSVGNLVPRKGHDILLRTLAGLADLDWSLSIVGAPLDPVHADGLVGLAGELGLSQRVRFAGGLTPEGLEAEWQRADVFALATHFEGYGMVAAEALARGLPVAITAGGAIADVVPVEASVVSPPGDVVSFTKGLRRLIFDGALRADMAAAAWHAGQRLPRWPERAAAFLAELEAA